MHQIHATARTTLTAGDWAAGRPLAGGSASAAAQNLALAATRRTHWVTHSLPLSLLDAVRCCERRHIQPSTAAEPDHLLLIT